MPIKSQIFLFAKSFKTVHKFPSNVAGCYSNECLTVWSWLSQ